MHGLVEVDGVEALDLIPVVREQVARVLQERALGVGDEVVGVQLHDVGGDVVERLAGAGAADDQHVQVPVQLGIVFGPVEGESVVLGEDQVVVLVGLVLECLALLEGAPACRTALLARTVVAHEGHKPQPHQPHHAEHAEADEQGCGRQVEMQGPVKDEGPHAGEGVAPMVEELARLGGDGLPVPVAEIEAENGQQEGDQCRDAHLPADLRIAAVLCHAPPPTGPD